MANTNGTKPLNVHPVPAATQYNRLAMYGLAGAGVLVLGTYVTVMSSRGKGPQWERPEQFVTLNRQLVTEAEKPPLPPPPPQPIPPPEKYPEPIAATPPPPAPAKPNPDIERRRAAKLKAMSAKVLVEGFSPDKQQAVTPVGTAPPQPQNGPPSPQMYAGWNGQPMEQPQSFMGSSRQLWQDSSHTNEGQYLGASIQAPRSPFQVNAGTILPAVLAQAIISDLEGTVTAQVSQDVYDSVTGRYLLIPQGSRLFGVYDADLRANQPRLQLAFKTLYFPNGYSLSLQGMPGADQRGLAGLTDQVNRHFFQRYGTAAILSLITAGISLATDSGGHSYYGYDPEQAAMHGAGQVMGRAIAEDLHRAMSIRPTVTVPEAYPFTLTVTQDITFPGSYPFEGGAE